MLLFAYFSVGLVDGTADHSPGSLTDNGPRARPGVLPALWGLGGKMVLPRRVAKLVWRRNKHNPPSLPPSLLTSQFSAHSVPAVVQSRSSAAPAFC